MKETIFDEPTIWFDFVLMLCTPTWKLPIWAILAEEEELKGTKVVSDCPISWAFEWSTATWRPQLLPLTHPFPLHISNLGLDRDPSLSKVELSCCSRQSQQGSLVWYHAFCTLNLSMMKANRLVTHNPEKRFVTMRKNKLHFLQVMCWKLQHIQPVYLTRSN